MAFVKYPPKIARFHFGGSAKMEAIFEEMKPKTTCRGRSQQKNLVW